MAAKMLEIAQSNHRKSNNVELKLNSKTNLSLLASELFDFVLSLIVLQHMPWRYVKAYLSKLVRAAKPGGIIVFQIPTRSVAPFNSWAPVTPCASRSV